MTLQHRAVILNYSVGEYSMKIKRRSLLVSGVALLTMALAGPSVSHAAKRIYRLKGG